MQPITFSKAGKLMLNKYVNGVPVKSAATSCFRNGVVQTIQPNVTINGSPIADGNSLWPAANPDTSIEGSIAVTLGYMPAELYAFIMGDTSQELTNAPFPVVDEELVIPSSAPFTVKLKHEPLTTTNFILVGADGKPWEKAEAAAEAGKYYISAETPDTLEFVEADNGKPVYAAYEFSAAAVTEFGLPKTPVRATYEIVIVAEAMGEDDTLYETALIVDRAKAMGAIGLPSQGGTPQPVTVNFTVLRPRGNKRAVDYKTTPLVV